MSEPAADTFGASTSIDAPYTAAVAITPHDTNELATVTRGLYIGGAGNVAAVLADGGDAVTLTALAVGVIHRLRVRQVLATGTTATGIVGLV